MEIITQTILSFLVTESLKLIGVNMLFAILVILGLFFYVYKKYKLSKLEKILLVIISYFIISNLCLLFSINQLNENINLQKQIIEKQEKIILDYKTKTKNFLKNLENLDNKIQRKLEVQEFIKNFSEGHQK